MKLYSVYDNSTEEYSAPMCCKNDNLAVRSFVQFLWQAKQNAKKMHFVWDDSEFSLKCIGEFDADTGTVFGNPPRDVVVDVAKYSDILADSSDDASVPEGEEIF